MLNKKTIEDIEVAGKKVLVRCDFNVPLDENKNITDENRLIGALPTIKYLIDHKAKVILCSHLGRPKGEFNPKFSLAPVAKRLSELLGQEVKMADDVIGDSAKALASSLKDGEVSKVQISGENGYAVRLVSFVKPQADAKKIENIQKNYSAGMAAASVRSILVNVISQGETQNK